jgi:hypothetical protein
MSKDDLLQQIKTDHRQLCRYLFFFEKDHSGDFVPSRRLKFKLKEMQEPGVVAEWSLKDILAHLTGWENYFLEWYNSHRFGKDFADFPPDLSWADKDEINHLIYTRTKDRSLDEVLDEFRTSYRKILQTTEAIPEDVLTAVDRFPWTGNQSLTVYLSAVTWEHYRWAKKHIRRWSRTGTRQGRDKENLLKRIQTERRRLEKNLASLSEEEMSITSVIGKWSVKDILAHLVDWERRFLGWYQAGLQGQVPQTPAPGMTWKDLDRLNQMIYEENKDRSLDSILVDFENSYHEVLETVRAIPEEDFYPVGRFAWTGKSNLATYILANTANHYRWAKTQIRKWMREKG